MNNVCFLYQPVASEQPATCIYIFWRSIVAIQIHSPTHDEGQEKRVEILHAVIFRPVRARGIVFFFMFKATQEDYQRCQSEWKRSKILEKDILYRMVSVFFFYFALHSPSMTSPPGHTLDTTADWLATTVVILAPTGGPWDYYDTASCNPHWASSQRYDVGSTEGR